MRPPDWTILIAALGRRRELLIKLMDILAPQLDAAAGRVTVQVLWNNGEQPLPDIRHALIRHTTARYACFLDDDDMVPATYVARQLPLLDGQVDYVGWRVNYFTDGLRQPPGFHSLRYTGWSEDEDGWYRDITHLNPVRRELAVRYGDFRTAGWPEDSGWAAQLRGHLITEAYVDAVMYTARHSTKDSTQCAREDGRPWLQYPVAPEGTRPLLPSPHISWHPESVL
jgi:hypothetical protein